MNKKYIIFISFVIIGSVIALMAFHLIQPEKSKNIINNGEIFEEKKYIEEIGEEEKGISKIRQITLEIADGKMLPNHFIVPAGSEVILTLISKEKDRDHTFVFEDKRLPQLKNLGDPSQQDRPLYQATFTAPEEPGEYIFYCLKEGHREKGEEGKMIVFPKE